MHPGISWNDLRWPEPRIHSSCPQPPTMILSANRISWMYGSAEAKILAPFKPKMTIPTELSPSSETLRNGRKPSWMGTAKPSKLTGKTNEIVMREVKAEVVVTWMLEPNMSSPWCLQVWISLKRTSLKGKRETLPKMELHFIIENWGTP